MSQVLAYIGFREILAYISVFGISFGFELSPLVSGDIHRKSNIRQMNFGTKSKVGDLMIVRNDEQKDQLFRSGFGVRVMYR